MYTDDTLPSAAFPTRFGMFRIYAFREGGMEHLALVHGNVWGKDAVPVRIHSQCITGDALGSLRCDCGIQLEDTLEFLASQSCGILFYMGHEGRGIGLFNKIRAYALQDEGADTVEANNRLGYAADLRDYGIVASVLQHFGIASVRLITNNPDKVRDLAEAGIEVVERIPLVIPCNEHNESYLKTKKDKMNHIMG
jgi:GTP cyclohydrolase II